MYEVIFIDWFGTLSNSLYWEHLEYSNPEVFKLISDSLLIKNNLCITPWMRGKYSTEKIVKVISEDTGLNSGFVMNELVKSAKSMEFVSNEVPILVNKIRETGTKVVIATDNMDTFTRWTVPCLKLNNLFDNILNSWGIKALKGDFKDNKSLFFDKFLKNHLIEPEDCLLIDDSEDKLEKISNYGINYRRTSSTKELVNELMKLL